VRDRLSFSRFLGLAIEDSIPDATTLWLFREKLAKAEMIEKLFDRFDQHLAAKGYMAAPHAHTRLAGPSARARQISDAVQTTSRTRSIDGHYARGEGLIPLRTRRRRRLLTRS
jgi:IS5 family transposase